MEHDAGQTIEKTLMPGENELPVSQPAPPIPSRLSMQKALTDLRDRIIEILQGAILFVVIAGVGWAIHLGVGLINTNPSPDWSELVFINGLKGVSIVIFIGDIIYFLSFFIAQVKHGVVGAWKQ